MRKLFTRFQRMYHELWRIRCAGLGHKVYYPRPARRRSKFYVVKAGKIPGLYYDYHDALEQISGVSCAIWKSFNSLVEALAYQQTDDSTSDPTLPPPLYEIFTDGSFSSDPDRAGWAFVAVARAEEHQPYQSRQRQHHHCESVRLNPSDSEYLGADHLSNNTAELSAIGQALRWIQSPQAPVSSDGTTYVCLHSDSQYALNMTKGLSRPTVNKKLVKIVRQLYSSLPTTIHLTLNWTKAHESNELSAEAFWNNEADKLAAQGAAKGQPEAMLIDLNANILPTHDSADTASRSTSPVPPGPEPPTTTMSSPDPFDPDLLSTPMTPPHSPMQPLVHFDEDNDHLHRSGPFTPPDDPLPTPSRARHQLFASHKIVDNSSYSIHQLNTVSEPYSPGFELPLSSPLPTMDGPPARQPTNKRKRQPSPCQVNPTQRYNKRILQSLLSSVPLSPTLNPPAPPGAGTTSTTPQLVSSPANPDMDTPPASRLEPMTADPLLLPHNVDHTCSHLISRYFNHTNYVHPVSYTHLTLPTNREV